MLLHGAMPKDKNKSVLFVLHIPLYNHVRIHLSLSYLEVLFVLHTLFYIHAEAVSKRVDPCFVMARKKE